MAFGTGGRKVFRDDTKKWSAELGEECALFRRLYSEGVWLDEGGKH
jgi:hypothetical protein